MYLIRMLSLLILMLSTSLSACASQTAGITAIPTITFPTQPPTQTPNPPTATEDIPIATEVIPTATEEFRNIPISLPGAPQISPSDVLDQVVFEGVGGREHVCTDLSELCVEPRENGVYLVGFEPDQEIIILMYQDIPAGKIYYTQWNSIVEIDGTLLVEILNLDFEAHYVVLDAMTKTYLVGSAPLTPEYQDYYSHRYFPCTQANYTSRLKLGDKVRVAYVDGSNLRIRSSPDHSTQSNVIGGIPEGTVIYIERGPECQGGWIWWQVFYDRKYGWVSEGDGTSWLLEPWE